MVSNLTKMELKSFFKGNFTANLRDIAKKRGD